MITIMTLLGIASNDHYYDPLGAWEISEQNNEPLLGKVRDDRMNGLLNITKICIENAHLYVNLRKVVNFEFIALTAYLVIFVVT